MRISDWSSDVCSSDLLLSQIDPSAYVAVDISGDFLRESSAVLSEAFPDLPVRPVEADFNDPVDLPRDLAGLPRLGFFPGSTIGNLDPADAVDLLRSFRRSLGQDAMLLIGMDRIKDVSILIPAYDDRSEEHTSELQSLMR